MTNADRENLAEKLDVLEMFFLRYMNTETGLNEEIDTDAPSLAELYHDMRKDIITAHNVSGIICEARK